MLRAVRGVGDGVSEQGSAARRWDCVVLPDVIDAMDENEARVEFIQALAEDMSLIRVSEHHDDKDVDDAA